MNAQPSGQNRILLVEDEAKLRKGIRINLEAEGYTVAEFPDGESALASMDDDPEFDLGILDIMMPGAVDGIELCRRLRERRLLFPVIFLTARNGVEDKLAGLNAGADDYLTKPFDLGELLARVAAGLRRAQWNDAPDFRIGGFSVDLASASARPSSEQGGEVVRFNEREIDILRLLLENRGRPVSRDQILDRVWGTAEYPTNRTIDNYIVKFRKIFEAEPQTPRHFITRHGIGYELANDDKR
ncbi:MAG: response regulator transcription factor, partial [Leptospirales bacterium]|jgi:two-component system alkaline phosphatase synthesis response regulator PhoP